MGLQVALISRVNRVQRDMKDGEDEKEATKSPLEFEINGNARAQLLNKFILVVDFVPSSQPPNGGLAGRELLIFTIDSPPWMAQCLLK